MKKLLIIGTLLGLAACQTLPEPSTGTIGNTSTSQQPPAPPAGFKSDREAVEAYWRAAQTADAFSSLAWLPGDYEALANQALPLAVSGDADAQFIVGQLYYLGQGIAQDPVAGVGWFRNSADQGNAAGRFGLATALYMGEGIERDVPESIRLMTLAADQNLLDAQITLVTLYSSGDPAVRRDLVEAYKWLLIASNSQDLGEIGSVLSSFSTEMSQDEIATATRRASLWRVRR